MFGSETVDEEEKMAQVLVEEIQRLNSVFGNSVVDRNPSDIANYNQQINQTVSGMTSTVTDTSSPLQAVAKDISFEKIDDYERLQSFKDNQRASV